ncbi:MAG: Cof-type HAD-IIB family hydrolase [Christensenellaceae bacterium]|jgi:Cof subfamily protein (haloacid dehalogenase superfamily)|nr:Cof-type HAD-IIB family hydrolase [Christensenellaceae bacterium]
MKYKMIVSDLDDTILASDLTYDKQLKDTIAKYKLAGGTFVIATGRMTSSVLPYCNRFNLKGHLISYQGARISDIAKNNILLEKHIDHEVLYHLLKQLDDEKIYHQFYLDEKIYVKKITDYSRMYAKFISAPFVELQYPLFDFVLNNRVNILKAIIIADPQEVSAHVIRLNKKYGDQLIINTSKPWIVELISKSAGKGSAVHFLAKHYNLSPHEIICIGDSSNDVSMIEYAGIGVAVANASLEAYRAANIICPSCKANGVRSIIEKYGFLD